LRASPGVDLTADLHILEFADIDEEILAAFLEDEGFLVEIKDLPLQFRACYLHLDGLA
jgi:hypothetical protein